MNDVFSLIKILTRSEWKSLQKFLSIFSRFEEEEIKQLQLARMLWKEESCPSSKVCSQNIYKNDGKSGLAVLNTRLMEKVLDFSLTDISTDKQKYLDPADLVLIKIHKRYGQFRQLLASGKKHPLLYEILDEIIFLTGKYEQYSLLSEALRLKKGILSWKLGKKHFEEVNRSMQQALIFSEKFNRAEHFYYQLMMEGDFSSKYDKAKVLEELKRNIAEVKAGIRVTNSTMCTYFLKNMQLSYYHLQEKFHPARSICLELLDIVRNNKPVYRRQRIGVVYDNLSRCEYYLGNYKQAAECARDAQKHFKLNSENYCVGLEQEYYALFAMKQYGKCWDLAQKMLVSASRKELGEFRFSKYNYLLANTLFVQGDLKPALSMLTKRREISTDKAGWEIGARTLRIMTLIELEKHDEAATAIISLKQYFRRTDKTTPVSRRDKSILNLLEVLVRAGFMFCALGRSAEKHIAALDSKLEPLRWEPFTHEVIPFHEWFAAKMEVKLPITVSRLARDPAPKKERVLK